MYLNSILLYVFNSIYVYQNNVLANPIYTQNLKYYILILKKS